MLTCRLSYLTEKGANAVWQAFLCCERSFIWKYNVVYLAICISKRIISSEKKKDLQRSGIFWLIQKLSSAVQRDYAASILCGERERQHCFEMMKIHQNIERSLRGSGSQRNPTHQLPWFVQISADNLHDI